MTGVDHEHSAAVEEAAVWLASQPEHVRFPVPAIRERFGLTAVEACEVIAIAQRFRTVRRAFG